MLHRFLSRFALKSGKGFPFLYFALFLAAIVGRPAIAQTYSITDLGTLGGSSSTPTAINDAGQVIGYSYLSGDTTAHAFLYSGGQMKDLGTLGGTYSSADAINASGQVLGFSDLSGASDYHTFLYSDGQMKDLGTLGGTYSLPTAINDAGQVIGYSNLSGYTTAHAFLYSDGQMKDLSTVDRIHGNAVAVAINASGQVVGNFDFPVYPYSHPFLYSDGQMKELGTLGNTYQNAKAAAINASGQVVGFSEISGDTAYHAFLYSGGQMKDLGTLGGTYSRATAINDAGQVVGFSDISGDRAYHTFLYSDGQMKDLGTLGGSGSTPTAINASGQVLGNSYLSNGFSHPFLFSDGKMKDLNTLLPATFDGTLECTAINARGQIIGRISLNGALHGCLLTPTSIPPPTAKYEILDANFDYTHTDLSDGALSNISPSDPNLVGASVARVGAVADGATKLLLRYTASSPGTVTFGDTPALAGEKWTDINGNPATNVATHVIDGKNIAFALYTVPPQMPDPQQLKINIKFTADFTPTGGAVQTTTTPDFIIERPPVLLVHGTWSKPDAWRADRVLIPLATPANPDLTGYIEVSNGDKTFDRLQQHGFDTAHGLQPQDVLVDWSGKGATGFAAKDGIFQPYLKNIEAKYRGDGVAITRCDVIAHSQGGILVRRFVQMGFNNKTPYRNPKNFNQGEFRRFIGLAIPNLGTEFANTIWDTYKGLPVVLDIHFADACAKAVGSITDGGVENLRVGSPAERQIAATPLLSHMITDQGTSFPTSSGVPAILNIFKTFGRIYDPSGNSIDYGETGGSIDDVFRGRANDTVVAVPSQQAGLRKTTDINFPDVIHPCPGVSYYNPCTHTEMQANDSINNEIIALLTGDETDFVTSLPAVQAVYDASDYDVLPFPTNARAHLRRQLQTVRAATSPLLTVTSPTATTVIQPGGSLTIQVQPVSGVNIKSVLFMLGSGDSFIGSAEVETAPFQATFTIPASYVGQLPITIYARDANGNIAPATAPTLTATTSATVKALNLSPDQSSLTSQRETVQLQALAYFSDNVSRDVADASTGTTYQSSAPTIATVSADGLVTALANGTATITATNHGQSAHVAVTVQLGVPQVMVTSPSSAEPNDTIAPLTIQGVDLGGASKVEFWLNGAPDTSLAATNIQVDSSGSNLTATLSVGANSALGARTVVVTTPGGQSSTVADEDNTFTVADKTAPSLTFTSPVNGTVLPSLSLIAGTVTDKSGGSGLSRVDLSLKRNSDGKYWTGTAWGTTTAIALTTTIQGANWSYSSLPTGNNLIKGAYTATATPFDAAGNNRSATDTFTIDPHLPTATVSLTPNPAKAGAVFKATATKADGDGDAVTLSYVWKRNGKVVSEQSGITLDGAALKIKKGEVVGVEVTPNDGFANGAIASAQLTVADTAPVASAQSVTLAQDTSKTITLGGTDGDGDALKYKITALPTRGTLLVGTKTLVKGDLNYALAGKTVVYKGNAGAVGNDSFRFVVSDGTLDSAVAIVSVTLTPVNHAPTIAAATFQCVENRTLSARMVASDPDKDALTFTVTSKPTKGTLTLGAAGAFTYVPTLNTNGSDTFTVQVQDTKGAKAAARMSLAIKPVNGAPTAVADSFSTWEDTSLSIPVSKLLANDKNGELPGEVDALSLKGFALPAGFPGTLTLDVSKTNLLLVPKANWNGTTQFFYTAMDSGGLTSTTTVSVTVIPVNDAPIASAATASSKGATVKVPLVASDVDGDALTFALATRPAQGVAIIAMENGKPVLTYTPKATFSGIDTFSFVASDGKLKSAPATIKITVTHPGADAPSTSNS